MANLFKARAPLSADGKEGDFFYDVARLQSLQIDLYGPKQNGSWPFVRTIGEGEIHLGTTSPGRELGEEGHFYFNPGAAMIWGPKGAGESPWGWSGAKVSLPNPIQEDEERRAREYRERQWRVPHSTDGSLNPAAAEALELAKKFS